MSEVRKRNPRWGRIDPLTGQIVTGQSGVSLPRRALTCAEARVELTARICPHVLERVTTVYSHFLRIKLDPEKILPRFREALSQVLDGWQDSDDYLTGTLLTEQTLIEQTSEVLLRPLRSVMMQIEETAPRKLSPKETAHRLNRKLLPASLYV